MPADKEHTEQVKRRSKAAQAKPPRRWAGARSGAVNIWSSASRFTAARRKGEAGLIIPVVITVS